jgi:hypothetical protein
VTKPLSLRDLVGTLPKGRLELRACCGFRPRLGVSQTKGRAPRYWVECVQCGQKTDPQQSMAIAQREWNEGRSRA